MILTKFNGINKDELSMIEVAHEILEQRGSVMEFNELLLAVQDYLELSENDLERKMFVFYTEINTDGSFISLGENRWGLRSWYPIDSIDEELASAFEDSTPTRRKKRKKLNAFATSEDDLDYNNDDPEDWIDDSDEEIDEEVDEDSYDALADLGDDEEDVDDTSADEDLSIVSEDELFEH